MVRSLMKSRIFFIGGGRFCKTFIHALLNANFSQDRPVILGIADKDPNAPGIQYAKELGIYITDDYTKLFKFKHIDIIIELTKDNDLAVYLRKIKPLGVKLVDHFEARALWDYFQIEERKYSVLKQLDACGNDTEKVKDIFEQFSGFFLDLAKKRNEYSQKTRKALLVSQMAISQVIEGSTIPTFTIDKNLKAALCTNHIPKDEYKNFVNYGSDSSFDMGNDSGNSAVLELKCYPTQVPLWFIDMVKKFELINRPFSKYVFGLRACLGQTKLNFPIDDRQDNLSVF